MSPVAPVYAKTEVHPSRLPSLFRGTASEKLFAPRSYCIKPQLKQGVPEIRKVAVWKESEVLLCVWFPPYCILCASRIDLAGFFSL